MEKKVYVVYFGGNSFRAPVVFSTKKKAFDFMETYIKEEEEKDSTYYNLENANGGMIRVVMSVEKML